MRAWRHGLAIIKGQRRRGDHDAACRIVYARFAAENRTSTNRRDCYYFLVGAVLYGQAESCLPPPSARPNGTAASTWVC